MGKKLPNIKKANLVMAKTFAASVGKGEIEAKHGAEETSTATSSNY